MKPIFLQGVTGMNLSTLGRVLLRNRGRVDRRYLSRLAYLAVLAVLNSYVGRLENAADGAAIAAAELVAPPIFILGAWRSGTTHLENLLNCDPDFTCPTAYQTMFPHHFVYSQPWGSKIFNFFTPGKRPMDNVAFHAAAPHEEEMALAGLCAVSPYLRAIFPVTGDRGYAALDPGELPPGALADWQAALRLFLKKLSFSKGRRLILKSPPHLGRVAVLVKMFPEAKFIHIVRNPYIVYLSHQKLVRRSWAYFHLQEPNPGMMDELILNWHLELFRLYQKDRGLIPPGNLHELRFEDLESSPQETLERLYAGLGLPDFERFWTKASAYLQGISGYRKNTYSLTAEDRTKVNRHWGPILAHYGYPLLDPES